MLVKDVNDKNFRMIKDKLKMNNYLDISIQNNNQNVETSKS
jgi:hypothetical protein